MLRSLISLALFASSTLAGYWAFAPKGLCFVRSPGDTAWRSWAYVDSASVSANSHKLGGSAAAAYAKVLGTGSDSLGNHLVVEATRFRGDGSALTGITGGGDKEDTMWFHTQTLTLSSQKASWDCAAGGVAELTITGAGDSLRSPTNLKAGRLVDVTIIQDGTGSRTLLWGSAYKWPGAVAPTLSSTAAARDKFLFRLTATTAELVTAVFDVR